MYKKVGQLLSRYKSGKIPKAFKIIPSLQNWEQVLFLTKPDKWSPHAVYEATRLFVSNLKPKGCQKFLQYILLDHVRADIAESDKLNIHLYNALKKSVYKPSAFFKGILFPLCESQCTLKEAAIIASVIAKVSIPVLHSAVALLKLCEMEYSGPHSLFLRVLLDKKYALPYRVVDGLVFHFIRLAKSAKRPLNPRERALPVLWHQALLVFVQRYKTDIAPDQKEALLAVLRGGTDGEDEMGRQKNPAYHPSITPEIRRELASVDTSMQIEH